MKGYERVCAWSEGMVGDKSFEAPSWAVNDSKLRRVIAEYLVRRSYGQKRLRGTQQKDADDITTIRCA